MHNIESNSMRYTLATAGLAASLIFLLASATANYRYGYNLARTPTDGVMYGVAAAAGDVFMAASPFFFFAAIRNKAFTQALAAFVVWAASTLFAAQAAISHASVNRMDAVSARTVSATVYADTRTELAEARKTRGFIPQHRPADTLKAEMERHKTNRHWSNTNECTEAAGKAARDYCSAYHALNAELGYAMQASKLDARIEALTSKSDKVSENNTAVQSEADPGARTLSVMSGIDIRTVQGLSIFMVAFLILLGAGLGPYISVSVLHTGPKPKVLDLTPEKPLELKAEAPNLALGAVPTPVLAIAPPKTNRREPSPEWRALLAKIDFPPLGARHKGDKRPKDEAPVSAARFLTWLASYKEAGDFHNSKIDQLFEEFLKADHRELTALRVVKPELEAFGRRIAFKWQGTDGVMWTIQPPELDKMVALLQKRGVLPKDEPPKDAPADNGRSPVASVIPFSAGSGGQLTPDRLSRSA